MSLNIGNLPIRLLGNSYAHFRKPLAAQSDATPPFPPVDAPFAIPGYTEGAAVFTNERPSITGRSNAAGCWQLAKDALEPRLAEVAASQATLKYAQAGGSGACGTAEAPCYW
jgi:hypothetical protein